MELLCCFEWKLVSHRGWPCCNVCSCDCAGESDWLSRGGPQRRGDDPGLLCGHA
jgi:hypothetical protein